MKVDVGSVVVRTGHALAGKWLKSVELCCEKVGRKPDSKSCAASTWPSAPRQRWRGGRSRLRVNSGGVSSASAKR